VWRRPARSRCRRRTRVSRGRDTPGRAVRTGARPLRASANGRIVVHGDHHDLRRRCEPRSVNVLHVVAPAPVGGLERVVLSLASGLHARGHRVALAAVVTPGASEPPLLAALRARGVEVRAVAIGGRHYLEERRAVRDLCRALRPDVVHTHGYRPDVVDAPVARGLGVPVVTTVHGFTGGGWKGRLYERLQLRAFRRFDAVVVVSSPLAERVARAGTPPARIHLVRNAWPAGSGDTPAPTRAEARRALGLPAEGVLAGWVGRFTREKGPDVFVRAVAEARDAGWSGVMVGAGPDARRCRALASRLAVAARIAWPGLVPDAGRWLAAFDVFVLSSRSEGTPMVLFEAIAAGVPVVATRVGGVPDVVGASEALLVAPDDPAALAAAVRAVLADPAAAAARAAAARLRLGAEFAEQSWLDRYEAVYGGIVRR